MKNRDYKLTNEQRARYKETTLASAKSKKEAIESGILTRKVNIPLLNPEDLMPLQKSNGLRSLSLFSGGGGLDLGFERAGFEHSASFDILPICGDTLKFNRPEWKVFAGEPAGDVKNFSFAPYRKKIDIVHGGPPCQPFSIAGQQEGIDDERNMWGPFVEIVNRLKPKAFIAENVKGILNPKFKTYVSEFILEPLNNYHIHSFVLNCAGFGVPQKRERVFFVGFRSKISYKKYCKPAYTHNFNHFIKNGESHQQNLFDEGLPKCMGMREALGLPDIGIDTLCPTIRCAFTGKRHTTSILNSTASANNLAKVGIWGSGVGSDRKKAAIFPTKNGHFRLSVQDCAILQGFPESWKFQGAVYKVLGQIGNSVAPPVGYHVADSVSKALIRS